MPDPRFSLTTAAVTLCLMLTPSLLSAAPTLWGGAATSNMVSDARDLPTEIGNIEPLWEVRLGTHQYTIPTISGDFLFAGANDTRIDRPGIQPTGGGVLYCLDRSNGRVVW